MSDSQLQDLFRDHHPSEALLRSWLAGNASDHDASQINVHVAQCSHCELILLRLESSDQDFLSCFRAYRDHWELGQTGLKQTKVEDDRFAATLIESASSSARHFSAVSRSHLLGKFLPGTKLAGRYQIVSLIGRGGMGEVYRADDMKLGQTVALKFLTDRAGRSEQRLQYFLDEVRLSQRLSHPYICRVHDVVEYESHLFLSMEYVEGENLSELLKRTGPLTESKAIELGGQLCQGLAAAHDAGVLHRDLKPANIMVDHRGRARIADFGLAREHGVLNPREGIVGTPLYMAPEQLKSNQTSVQSDLYSLGLIVYEMFTGSKAHQAKDVDEISKLHESGVAIQCVTEAVQIESQVAAAIAKCLAKDPRDRFSSVAAFAAALPGKSALSVAVATGQTLSPDMISIAGPRGSLPRRAIAGLLTLVTLLLVVVGLMSSSVFDSFRFELPPQALANQAEKILDDLKAPRGAFRTWGFEADADALGWASEHGVVAGEVKFLNRGHFWYRESESDLAPLRPDWSGDQFLNVEQFRPNLEAGSLLIRLSGDGELRYLERKLSPNEIPPNEIPQNKPRDQSTTFSDWIPLLRLAGLTDIQIKNRVPVTAIHRTQGFADSLSSWTTEVESPSGPIPLRIDVAASGNEPTYFRVSGPWDPPTRNRWDGSLGSNRMVAIIFLIWIPIMIAGTIYLARRNVYAQLSDLPGANRVAAFSAALVIVVWLVGGAHVQSSLEMDLFMTTLAGSALVGSLVWCNYLAFEPLMRREYPGTLVSWSRLLEGKFQDRLVGRHLLIGVAAGAAVAAGKLSMIGFPALLGHESADAPNVYNLLPLVGGRTIPREVLTALGMSVVFSIFYQLMLLALLRLIVRKMFIAVSIFVAFMAFRVALQYEPFWFAMTISVLEMSLTAFLFLRVGLFAVVTMHFTRFMLKWPIALDFSTWYAPTGLFALTTVMVLALIGAVICRPTNTAVTA
jgi:serine/threonine-protein kinase